MLKHITEQLTRTFLSLSDKADDMLYTWNDDKALELHNIICECLEAIYEVIKYLEFAKKQIKKCYRAVKQYEEIQLVNSSSVAENIVCAEKVTPKIQTISEIKSWLGKVNPNYTGDIYDYYSYNCGSCALSVFNKLNGGELKETTTDTYTKKEMESITGKLQITKEPEDIYEFLISKGAGSHVIVGIDRANTDGHWFNAYYDGFNVYAIDGQNNTIQLWYPTNLNAVSWDISI